VTVTIEVSAFTGPYAGKNAPPTSYPIGLPELLNRAITVGGFVVGSAAHRTMRRGAIGALVRSSVHVIGAPPALSVTLLYERTESSEKAGITFRLGMAFAAIAASRILGVPALTHVGVLGGGRRADLVGADALNQTHIVEAKARAHGFSTTEEAHAKAQATNTAANLLLTGTTAATASTCLTDLSNSPLAVKLTDPPGSEDEPRRLDRPELLREYYSVVPELLSMKDREPSGIPVVDDHVDGAWLPGGDIWIGLERPLLETGRTTQRWDRVMESAMADERLSRENDRDGQHADDEDLARRSFTASDGHTVVLREHDGL